MKRSPLRPGAPPVRRTALRASKPPERTSEPQRGGRIRSRSAKRDRFMREERVPLTRAMLDESPWCELGPVLEAAIPGHRCLREAIGLHERRKRSAQGSMTNRANLLRTCGPCNSLVEDNADADVVARAAGLVVREGDPGFEDLGR